MAKSKKSGRTPQHDKRPPRSDRSGGHGGGHGSGHDKIWLYGNHSVEAALANPLRKKHKLVVAKEFSEARHDGIEAEVMDRRDIDRLLPPGAVHQGMALLASPLPEPDLAAISESAAENSILVVLDQANDPRNVGAVLRSAAAFGAEAVIVPDRHTPEATGCPLSGSPIWPAPWIN
jgi:23S rRNA (guanosine2251-2'-O)-methyltransferase